MEYFFILKFAFSAKKKQKTNKKHKQNQKTKEKTNKNQKRKEMKIQPTNKQTNKQTHMMKALWLCVSVYCNLVI
jgi:hypothetical protein